MNHRNTSFSVKSFERWQSNSRATTFISCIFVDRRLLILLSTENQDKTHATAQSRLHSVVLVLDVDTHVSHLSSPAFNRRSSEHEDTMRRYYYFIFRKIFTNWFCVRARRVVMRWHMWARVVAFIMDLLALTWERVMLLLLLLYILSFDFGILLISRCVAWSFRTNEWANHLIRSNLTIVDTHRHTRINLLIFCRWECFKWIWPFGSQRHNIPKWKLNIFLLLLFLVDFDWNHARQWNSNEISRFHSNRFHVWMDRIVVHVSRVNTHWFAYISEEFRSEIRFHLDFVLCWDT